MVVNTRKNILKKKTLGIGALETRQEDRIHYENAFNTALKTLNMQNINLKTMLKDLTKEQLHEIMKIPLRGGSIENKIKQISLFKPEMQALTIIEDKIQFAKDKLLEVLKESFIIQYTNEKGNWNFKKFKSDVEIAIEKLNDRDDKMDDNV